MRELNETNICSQCANSRPNVEFIDAISNPFALCELCGDHPENGIIVAVRLNDQSGSQTAGSAA